MGKDELVKYVFLRVKYTPAESFYYGTFLMVVILHLGPRVDLEFNPWSNLGPLLVYSVELYYSLGLNFTKRADDASLSCYVSVYFAIDYALLLHKYKAC